MCAPPIICGLWIIAAVSISSLIASAQSDLAMHTKEFERLRERLRTVGENATSAQELWIAYQTDMELLDHALSVLNAWSSRYQLEHGLDTAPAVLRSHTRPQSSASSDHSVAERALALDSFFSSMRSAYPRQIALLESEERAVHRRMYLPGLAANVPDLVELTRQFARLAEFDLSEAAQSLLSSYEVEMHRVLQSLHQHQINKPRLRSRYERAVRDQNVEEMVTHIARIPLLASRGRDLTKRYVTLLAGTVPANEQRAFVDEAHAALYPALDLTNNVTVLLDTIMARESPAEDVRQRVDEIAAEINQRENAQKATLKRLFDVQFEEDAVRQEARAIANAVLGIEQVPPVNEYQKAMQAYYQIGAEHLDELSGYIDDSP